jgi:hypothetical protein
MFVVDHGYFFWPVIQEKTRSAVHSKVFVTPGIRVCLLENKGLSGSPPV